MHALQNRTGVRVCVCVFPLVHLMEFHAPLNHFQWKNISVDRREMAVHVSSSKDFQAYFWHCLITSLNLIQCAKMVFVWRCCFGKTSKVSNSLVGNQFEFFPLNVRSETVPRNFDECSCDRSEVNESKIYRQNAATNAHRTNSRIICVHVRHSLMYLKAVLQWNKVCVLAIETETPFGSWILNKFFPSFSLEKDIWLAFNQYACQNGFFVEISDRLWCWFWSLSSFKSRIQLLSFHSLPHSRQPARAASTAAPKADHLHFQPWVGRQITMSVAKFTKSTTNFVFRFDLVVVQF